MNCSATGPGGRTKEGLDPSQPGPPRVIEDELVPRGTAYAVLIGEDDDGEPTISVVKIENIDQAGG